MEKDNSQKTESLKEIIHDTVYLAVQATKQENSSLVADIRKDILAVKQHLDRQDTDLIAYGKIITEHIANDEEYQKRSEPMLKVFENNNITSIGIENKFKKLVLYVGGTATVGSFISGLLYLIYWTIKHLKL
jgi:hypothetical protein